jgi:hypothetical protein
LFFKLTVRAVLQMSYDTDGERLRRRWGSGGTAGFRALALYRRRPPEREQELLQPRCSAAPQSGHCPAVRGVQGLSQVGEQVAGRSLNVQPTITVRPCLPVRVIVNLDLRLCPYLG